MDQIVINLNNLVELIINASENTLDYWKNALNVTYKDDKSPLTEADLTTNAIICSKLLELYPTIPIISEENSLIDYEIRSFYRLAWSIDPIDGTKEFINGGDDYTVNIGLICDGIPILGLVTQPVNRILYYGWIQSKVVLVNSDQTQGAYRMNYGNLLKIPLTMKCQMPIEGQQLIIVASKSHMNEATQTFLRMFPNATTINIGSSLKIINVADNGQAHLYPRLGLTSEWDIAAAHAILKASGGELMALTIIDNKYEMKPMQYNKKSMLNSWFICGHINFLSQVITSQTL